MLKLTPEEHKYVAQYIHEISGITIEYKRAYLIETRLYNLVQDFGLSSYIELCRMAKSDLSKSTEKMIIDAITTNETLFFRDTEPFELIEKKILPDLVNIRRKQSNISPIPIRIWSSACSTGQEIFSIAIVLKELLSDIENYDIELLGTDISDAAVVQASQGIYNKFEIERGLEISKLNKYFYPDGNNWKIKDEIKNMATFMKHNLMKPFNRSIKFDIIFCRNVAIYFYLEDRKYLFEKIAKVLQPDGYLIIGATESLTGICPMFEAKRHLGSVYYQLKDKNDYHNNNF
ncbi:CheR family methyltransferase [Thermodesulfobacteriota bacterium]